MQVTEKIIQSGSGQALPLMIRTPDMEARGVIQINTGTCIPQKIYWRFAEFLAEQGYISITYDYSDAQNLRSDVSHTAWLKDMESVFNFVLSEYPGLRKIIIGHSSGGQLLGMLPNSHRADRIYLVASANGYWKLMDGLSKYVMWIFWQVVVPLNIKIFGYFNNRIFGSGGGFPRNIILELRSFCQQSEFFFPFFISKQVVPRYSDIKTRVTAYHLEGDAIANEKACRYIYDLYDQADRQFITLKASDHGLKKFGHRSFFSSSAKQIWKDLLTDLESS